MSSSLRAVKLTHTAVWAIFATCIVLIPVFALRGEHARAAVMIAIVFVEVLVLIANGGRCPLTAVAARYTQDRRANFDIYLPEWLARHNKSVFGVLYLAGIALTWMSWP
jgi:hypothetical protein